MGNGASQSRREKDIRLIGTGLRFTSQQLTALSNHFSDQLDSASGELKCDPDRSSAEALIERLIQRLICGVGTLDHRFSSKFLITLDPTKSATEPGLSFSYLVRLDGLSQPALYPDQWDQPTCQIVEGDGGPQGFSKIRIQGEGSEKWAEFVNNNGYLRRDKIQERFVELLAQSAARTSVPGRPEQIDESRLCGSPGKVVDAGIAENIIHTKPEEQMYFGAAECNRNRFPDPREYRIAIVEGAPCVRLRIGLLPSLCLSTLEEDIQVTMTLGIGFIGWPQTCDFPARIPLCHADALLYQQAATTGFYLVPAPPHPTVRCDDRTATWQFRFPAAELALLTHYSPQSLPSRVLAMLRLIVSELRRTTNGGHVISDYMLKTILWFRLEEDKDTVMETLKEWDHEQLALHILMVLDTLIASLRTQRYRSYFFPWFNVMLNSPGGGTLHYTEEDYTHDAQLLESFLFRLNQMTPHLPSSSSHDHDCWRKMESKLIHKWSDVLNDLSPPTATRSRRLSGNSYSTAVASQYSNRQLEYIGHILRGMLQVRSLTMSQCPYVEATWFTQNNNNNNVNSLSAQTTLCDTESSEDLIFLLKAILEQARNLALMLKDKNKRTRTSNNRCNNRYSNVNRKYNRNNTAGGGRSNVLDSFDASVCSLVEEIRKDKAVADLSDDNVLVRQVLRWLYYGVDKDKRVLSPVLRPYLNKLFTVSHENCWHLDEWTKRRENEEITALKKFCNLVVKEGLSPSDGIVDAVQKGWNWAENIIEIAGQMDDGVELIFTPRMGKVMRYRVRLSKLSAKNIGRNRTACNSLSRNSLTLEAYRKCAAYTAATMPRHNTVKDFLNARLNGEPYNLFDVEPVISPHCRLRAATPMVVAFETQRRYGAHRGLGSIVHALITLKKFSVLQEVSTLLPEDQRGQVLDDIQRVSKERRRARKTVGGTIAGNSGMLINRKYNNLSSDKRRRGAEKKYHSEKTLATYRPTDEFFYRCAGVQSSSSETDVIDAMKHIKLTDTLLGTCREARSRQNLNAVCNPMFFERPPAQWFHHDTTNTLNPLSQPMLKLTSDNSLAFQPANDFVNEMTSSSSFNNMASSLAKKVNGRKKDVVTKL